VPEAGTVGWSRTRPGPRIIRRFGGLAGVRRRQIGLLCGAVVTATAMGTDPLPKWQGAGSPQDPGSPRTGVGALEAGVRLEAEVGGVGLEVWGWRWPGGEGAHGGALMPGIRLGPSTFDPDLRAPLVTRSLIARPNAACAPEAATAPPFARRAHECCRQIHLPVGGHLFLLALLTPRPGGTTKKAK
jgi:hypothetical protein